MPALGAEPGCGRHLAPTVDTVSAQRNTAFLAELRSRNVLVLAGRAIHRSPWRWKQPDQQQLTSFDTGNKAFLSRSTVASRPGSFLKTLILVILPDPRANYRLDGVCLSLWSGSPQAVSRFALLTGQPMAGDRMTPFDAT